MDDRALSGLTEQFLSLSGVLFSEQSMQSMLDLTVVLAQDVIPATFGTGVTLIREGKKTTAAYTDDLVKLADELQYDLDEGPCLSSWEQGVAFRIDDMEQERRWPRWAPAASALGMNSLISVPLVVRGKTRMGAAKAYSKQPAAFDDRDARILSMFADQASLVLANAQAFTDAQQLEDQLKGALLGRQVLGQALGILMEREKTDESGAFTSLRQAAKSSGMTLQSIAEGLVLKAAERAQ